jgi:hypothetical protein
MASAIRVKEYLSQWLQLGQNICFDAPSSGSQQCLPCRRVIAGERYSAEFEELWQKVLDAPHRAHFAGGEDSFAYLLRPEVEVAPCPRCDLLTPCKSLGVRDATACPCEGRVPPLDPNGLMPRSPVQTRTHLSRICQHLSANQAP